MKVRAMHLTVAVAMALSAGVALADFSSAPIWSDYVYGDYVVGGTSTRTTATAGTQTGDPVSVSVNWPGQVKAAFLNWNYLSYDGAMTGDNVVTLNGTSVTADWTSISNDGDLCWGRDNTAAYTADVTAIVSAAGPGSFDVSGALDDAANGRLGEGVSLLVVFEDQSDYTEQRAVHVYEGMTIANGDAEDASGLMSNWLTAYPGGDAHFFVNALDGQETYEEDFYVNGTNVSGLVNGTAGAGNAWRGQIGPGPGGGLTVQYDQADDDVSAWMTAGDTALRFGTQLVTGNYDCIGHTFGAISFVPEPSALTLLVIGAGALWRRRS